jgi:hypothetical protein
MSYSVEFFTASMTEIKILISLLALNLMTRLYGNQLQGFGMTSSVTLFRKLGMEDILIFGWTNGPPNNTSLLSLANQAYVDTTLSNRDTLNPSGEWDLIFLDNLSMNIVNQILALPAPSDSDGQDCVGWRGINTHQFTVQSAYNLQQVTSLGVEGDWKTLWSWMGPHRIQTFIWLAAHGRILINFRRSKWRVGISPTCSCCAREDETVLHVLRDCIYATQVWFRLVPSNYVANFFSSLYCREWIFNNLNKTWIGDTPLLGNLPP